MQILEGPHFSLFSEDSWYQNKSAWEISAPRDTVLQRFIDSFVLSTRLQALREEGVGSVWAISEYLLLSIVLHS